MDPRLEEASRNGNLEALQSLLEENSLLLHQLSATISSLANNPLHIAALLGHDMYAREILRLKPELARDLNAQGLTPLHLASATGCLAVVKELMNVTVSSDLCRLRDKDGMLPVHVAAARGRFQVLLELINNFPESTRELTCRGETVIHLAVKSGCYEVLEFFIESAEGDEGSLLNAKDDRGNTILHLATDRRQLRRFLFGLGLEFPQMYLYLRFILYLWRIVGGCNGGEHVVSLSGLYLVMKRAPVIMLLLLVITFVLFQCNLMLFYDGDCILCCFTMGCMINDT